MKIEYGIRDLCRLVLPVVDYIMEKRPQYIIGCDAGGRLPALAAKTMYNRMYGRLPTIDGTMRFRRISGFDERMGWINTKEHLRPLAEEILGKKCSSVLVIDDRRCSGMTEDLARKAFSKLSGGAIEVEFYALVVDNPDMGLHHFLEWEWTDYTENIGVSYAGLQPRAVRSGKVAQTRKAIAESVDSFRLFPAR